MKKGGLAGNKQVIISTVTRADREIWGKSGRLCGKLTFKNGPNYFTPPFIHTPFNMTLLLLPSRCEAFFFTPFVWYFDFLWPKKKKKCWKEQCAHFKLKSKGVLYACALLLSLLEYCLFHKNNPRNFYRKVSEHMEERQVIPTKTLPGQLAPRLI